MIGMNALDGWLLSVVLKEDVTFRPAGMPEVVVSFV